jgi:large subunit ribosomal protein L25
MISAESNVLLEVQKREDQRMKSRKALREGLLLGIIYGKGIKENISVLFPKLNFMKVLDKSGEGTLIKLRVGEEKTPKDVLIQDIQYHTLTGDVTHVDFMAVSLEEEVEVEVPVEFVGVSPVVKDMGGIFVQNVENVEVRCKAKDIPKTITIDISSMATFDDMIHLQDVTAPAGVELMGAPDLVIAMVDEPRTDKEMEELEKEAAPDVTEVEGVKKEGEEAAVGEGEKAEESKEAPADNQEAK